MNDKEWLGKVYLAATQYEASDKTDQESIDRFIKWLYMIYGIVHPSVE